MKSLKERLAVAMSLTRAGQRTQALAQLEALRADALRSSDAADRATYFHTLASVLDGLGEPVRALEAAQAALTLDLAAWPESRGTFVALHTLVLILQRLQRTEEAGAHTVALLALGERLGGAEFAAAAVLAVEYLPRAKRLPLLEQARFQCKAVLLEAAPKGVVLEDLARTFANVAGKLSTAYVADGRLSDAERLLCGTTRLVAPLIEAPRLRQSLASTWGWLAALAERRQSPGGHRLFLRYALAVLDHPSMDDKEQTAIVAALEQLGGLERADDFQPLDVFRLISEGSPAWVGHPLQGCHKLAGAPSGAPWQFGDAIDVAIEKPGLAHARQ